MASVTYGKCIMANVIMAKIFMGKILWQMKLSPPYPHPDTHLHSYSSYTPEYIKLFIKT